MIHERAPKMKRQMRSDLQGKTTLPCALPKIAEKMKALSF
jgi:hypothetical protein